MALIDNDQVKDGVDIYIHRLAWTRERNLEAQSQVVIFVLTILACLYFIVSILRSFCFKHENPLQCHEASLAVWIITWSSIIMVWFHTSDIMWFSCAQRLHKWLQLLLVLQWQKKIDIWYSSIKQLCNLINSGCAYTEKYSYKRIKIFGQNITSPYAWGDYQTTREPQILHIPWTV